MEFEAIKASNGERAFAFFIDLVIYAIILQFLTWGISHLLYALCSIKTHQYFDRMKIDGALCADFIAFAIFCFKDIYHGVSLGKKITGICVREAQDPSQIPYYGNLVLRNLTLMILPIEILLVLFSRDGQRLGDRWCDTQVIERR